MLPLPRVWVHSLRGHDSTSVEGKVLGNVVGYKVEVELLRARLNLGSSAFLFLVSKAATPCFSSTLFGFCSGEISRNSIYSQETLCEDAHGANRTHLKYL